MYDKEIAEEHDFTSYFEETRLNEKILHLFNQEMYFFKWRSSCNLSIYDR